MNKMILNYFKEQIEQLGPVATIGNWGRVEWADNIYPQLGDKMYAAIDLEKFAELIVRECMSNLYLHGYDDAAKCLQDIHFEIDYPV